MTFEQFSENIVQKIQVSLKLTKMTSTLHEDLGIFMVISR